MKKRLALHKIGGLAIFTFISITFIFSVLYNHFCTERIAVRERHLAAVYQEIAPPQNAILIKETLSGEMVSRRFSARYQSEESRAALMNHYQAQLKAQGYVWMQKGNELITKKDGVKLTVRFEETEIQIEIQFDDIFQRIGM